MEPIIREATASEKEAKEKQARVEEEDEFGPEDDVPFTKRMKEATRKIHSVSDSLLKTKLGFAMSDDRIWAEGLLIFYEVFKFLEEAMERLEAKNEFFDRFRKVLEGAERMAAFESDLRYYYGLSWNKTCYELRPSLSNYIKHLKTLEEREPLRLLAYIYHMYMGMLSGGQILKKKRDIKNKITSGAASTVGYFIPTCMLNRLTRAAVTAASTAPISQKRSNGSCVTDFRIEGRTISSIKKDIVFTMNDIAQDLSKDERSSLIEESVRVFEWNNQIVGSIRVSWFDALRNVSTNPFVAFLLLGLIGSLWYILLR